MESMIEFPRVVVAALLAAVVMGNLAAANGQQKPVVSHATTSSAQATPRSTTLPPGSIAPAPQASLKTAVGAVSGFVLWNISAAHYKPSAPCQGLTLNVSTIAGPHSSGDQIVATTTSFTAQGPVTDYSAPGMPQYMLCVYALQKIPTGVYLRTTLTVQPSTFVPAVSAQNPKEFEIFGGNCNSGPQGTLSYILTGGELVCGNNAFNINFMLNSTAARLQKGPTVTPLVRGPATGPGMLSNGVAADDIATPDTVNRPKLVIVPPNASTSSSNSGATTGMLLPAVKPRAASGAPSQPNTGTATGMLVPAVRPIARPKSGGAAGAYNGGLNPGAAGGFTGGVRPALLPAFNGGLKVISGRRARNALAVNSSIIAVLHQQKQGGLSPTHTLAAGSLPSVVATQPNVRIQHAYVYSKLLTPSENALCKQWQLQNQGPEIFYVAGNPRGRGVLYSPDPQANPYTIVGCAFGNTKGSAVLELGNDTGTANTKPLYTVSVNPQSWNNNVIVVSLDPTTSHVPDWGATGSVAFLTITSANGKDSAGPAQFYARRQSVLLSSFSQNEASLYQQGSPYFMSPVANYYGLNGTVGVMRQSLPPNAVAAQDNFNLQLAPGFVVDSTQTDLLVANTSSNVTSQPATVNGNNITVTYPVLSAGAGSSTNYYSIYGLKVWVTGPAGVPPITPAP